MTKISDFFRTVYRFISHDVWRITETELSKSKRVSYRLLKVLVISIRRITQDNLVIRASALTYSILFALVPMIALFVAIGKGFGVENLIQEKLEDALVAQKELIPTILDFVEKYLESTQGGLFIGIGICILLFSVLNFFNQVERTFNSIWEVKKSRSIMLQITSYFSALFFIPVFMVLSGGISIYFNNLIAELQLQYILSPITRFGMKFTPYFISWIIFSFMYIAIPNTRVNFRNGAIAGIIAGTAFQFFQNIYINGQVYLSRYDVVYGSFAAIPLLLLWLQISCLIILLGAEISYASQNLQNYDYEGDSNNISIRYKKFLTLFLTYVIVKRFENNEPALKNDEIAAKYKLPIRLVNQILTELTDISIIIEIIDEDVKTRAYQPALDINKLTVNMLFERYESKGSELFLSNKNPFLDEFWHKHTKFQLKCMEPDNDTLIKDI
ncbi:MAG: YihY/virulence factor BrkB family protein [Paludibacter sp.]|nr:YihY/virulence factor BrkB family protein [Paludibacter sp.]